MSGDRPGGGPADAGARVSGAPAVDCSVVIVNYRSEARLAACLASLAAGAGGLGLETIVVDNSRTAAAEGLPARFPWVRLIESPANVGFARACNRGLGAARGRYLVLLNPDTVVHPGALATLVAYLDRHPRVGAVGPRLLDPDGTLQYSCRRFPGYLTVFFGRYALLTRLFPGNPASRDYLYLDWDHASPREVDWLSGACLMVRRAVFEQVGGLDEAYFLFVEDMDWCARIWQAGWAVAYVPEAVVTHHVGISRGPVPPRVVVARHRAMMHYVRKHLRPPAPFRLLIGAGLVARAALHILASAAAGARRAGAGGGGQA